MNDRNELLEKYASDLKEQFGETPDMKLLTQIALDLGPAIYDLDASRVAGSDERELATVKHNFLIKKLGLPDGSDLMEAISSVVEKYGKSDRYKYRAVVYYMLTKHFGKQTVYD